MAGVLGVVAILLAAGCSDDGNNGSAAEQSPEISADPAGAADVSNSSDPADTPTTTEPGPLDPTEIPGEPINQYNLSPRDCFDQIEDRRDGQPITITTLIPCDEPHHFEVFAQLTYPAGHPSTYPGDAVVRDFATASCYREFEAWVGTEYELSALEIGVIIPTRENFENDAARYRGIHCWVEHEGGDAMIGTSRNSGW